MTNRIILILLLFLISVKGYAQESLDKKMAFNNLINPTTNLFVHFDKNIYTNNETIYFTAYILKTGKFNINSHNILAVALIRDIDSVLIKSDKFPIEDGLSFGSMVVPDSTLSGNYHLIAYTDKLVDSKPELIFNQAILIKTNIEPPFKANIAFVEKPSNTNPTHKLLVSVTSNDNRFLPKPTTVNYRYGKINKTAKTDASSQLLLALPKSENPLDPNVYLKLKYANDSSYLSLSIPQNDIKANVRFYPEGGNLVQNIKSTIAWEVTNKQKLPIALTALLYKNNSIIDTIETDSYGIGKFQLLPETSAIYKVKLIHTGLADTVYTLPKVLDNGLVMVIENAVVQDTLKLRLVSNDTKKVFIHVHNFRNHFINTSLDLAYRQTLKIPLTDIPKGLNTITITDSLDRPLAERMFFAHYDNKELLHINTDSAYYHPREKVTLKLATKDLAQNAFASIAVVQENRIALKNSNDIESYTYIKNELDNIPMGIKGSLYKDKNFLEQILLVKGWRRYTWQSTNDLKATDTLKKVDSLIINGVVMRDKKAISLPLELATFGDEKIRTMRTSYNGYFNLNAPDFVVEYGRKIYLFVNSVNRDRFNIQINDGFNDMSQQFSKTAISPLNYANAGELPNNAELLINKSERIFRLKEVNIKGQKDENFNFFKGFGNMGTNACGDYVCKYNILNCKNHINDAENTQPVPGATYKGSAGPYLECKIFPQTEKSTFKEFSAIRYPKEFYIDNYKDLTEPAFFSTIYWNYGTILNKEKDTEITFYTSDITGMFKIIVQGATSNDVIYAEKRFEVKNKGQAR